MKNFLVIVALVMALGGCAREAHLYPANDQANASGVLTAKFSSWGNGQHEIEIDAPEGEKFTGEASVVRGGTMGFGTVYASVYGSGGYANGQGTIVMQTMPGGSPGTAAAFSNKNRSILCEFYNDNFSGHGNGACKRSDGALYRLQY